MGVAAKKLGPWLLAVTAAPRSKKMMGAIFFDAKSMLF
jgi:hypothetical protein